MKKKSLTLTEMLKIAMMVKILTQRDSMNLETLYKARDFTISEANKFKNCKKMYRKLMKEAERYERMIIRQRNKESRRK